MKNLFYIAIIFGVVLVFTACRDDGSQPRPVNSGNGGGTNNFAPASLQDRILNAQITSGSGVFTNSGNFVITPVGGTSGTFTSTGNGGTNSTSSGTFSYVPTPGNDATLVLDDPLLGTITMNLLFQTSVTGTFNSTSSQGGTQTGTFELQ